MASAQGGLPPDLPAIFRYSEARARISERTFRRLVADGSVVAISRGLYRRREWIGDEDLGEIAARASRATVCLRSALARHQLIDDIPAEYDIAVPRGSWVPTTLVPVRWHQFDPDTFEIGRTVLVLDSGRSIGLYSVERSIVDAYRMRHLDGADLANEALKRWLRGGGQPSELLRVARSFPGVQGVLRETMGVLL